MPLSRLITPCVTIRRVMGRVHGGSRPVAGSVAHTHAMAVCKVWSRCDASKGCSRGEKFLVLCGEGV